MVTLIPFVGYLHARQARQSAPPRLIPLAGLCLILALCGCGAAAFKTNSVAGGLTASNSTVAFGSVPVGHSSSNYVKLVNQGSSPVTISQLNVTGQAFSSSAQDNLPITVDAKGTLNLNVQFNPTVEGQTSGKLAITNSSTSTPLAVSLSGTGTAAGTAALSSITCASSAVTGSAADACTVTLSGAATSDVTVNLASDNSAVAVPSVVAISAGSTSTGFTATVSAVSSIQTATLTASAAGASQTFTLQLGVVAAALDVSTTSLSFGDVPVDSAAVQTLTLSSTGNAPVTINSVSVSGPEFTISGATFPLTLNPNQTTTFGVQFSSSKAGNVDGQLTLATNSTSGSTKAVKLHANAIPQLKQFSCATNSVASGGTNTCTVTLNSAAAATGQAVALASSNAAVLIPASVLIPGGATSAAFNATVSVVTSTQTATLTASSGGSSKNVNLQLGGAVPILTVSAANLVFGNVAVNTSATQSLTLSSTGAAAVTVSGASMVGAGFSISGAVFPLTLNPGQTATLAVQFNPTAAGAVSGQLTLTSNSSSGGSSVIGLSGTGTPVLTGLTCASGSITGAGTDSCSVTLNVAAATGGLVVNLNSNNNAVTLPLSATVPAGSKTGGFTATVASVTAAQSATLTASAGGITQSFSIQLNVGTSTLGVTATSIAFGNVNLNTPTTQTISLTSTGSAAVTISGISVSGAGFMVSGATLPLTLNPNQSATLNVVFDPTVSGAVTGQLTITSNSSSGSPTVISLTGAGVAYQVNLTWSAPVSSPDPIAGYNVYRGTSGSTNYQQLNTSVVTQTSYNDSSALISGQTYDYIVESVDASGLTSSPSNTFSAIIP